jgi:hypothetical protein
MPFSITFKDERLLYPYDNATTPAAVGLLVLGDHEEEFLSSLYQWNRGEYEAQWQRAIKLLLNGESKAALITEYLSPEYATHLQWRPMYRIGDTVFFQHHLLLYDTLREPFSVQVAFSFLQDRMTKNEEGKNISEWSVSLADIEAFGRTF